MAPIDSPEGIVQGALELALQNVDGDYSRLVQPEVWKNIFLAHPQLEALRKMKVSWDNGGITRSLGHHAQPMKEHGVELVPGSHGFIYFAHAAPTS
jgi:hypothetical protein